MFPANLLSVISVRGTDVYGSFISAYNPPPHYNSGPLYGTLAKKVPLHPGKMSGSSVATAIMACMVAIVFRFAYSEEIDKTCQERLRTLEGVKQLLWHMSVHQGNKRYYVHLWDLFSGAWDNPNDQSVWRANAAEQIEAWMRSLP